MAQMARLEYGRLTQAWKGEASDFTPLLAEQLDELGARIGVDLASVGKTEVATAGDRRIDIVAEDAGGAEFVIENQYGRADHDHLTRGLAYAVARRARGLVVVAEEHRDEFRAVAEYLNDLAELDPDNGIRVWLVEAKAVRIDASPWAPLFTAVVQPNDFTAGVEQAKQAQGTVPPEVFWAQFGTEAVRSLVRRVIASWNVAGYRHKLLGNRVVLQAPGPSKNGLRVVVSLYGDGSVTVPFASYGGRNAGISIDALVDEHFRSRADPLFGFSGTEHDATTVPGWLADQTVEPLLAFAHEVADAYRDATMTDQ